MLSTLLGAEIQLTSSRKTQSYDEEDSFSEYKIILVFALSVPLITVVCKQFHLHPPCGKLGMAKLLLQIFWEENPHAYGNLQTKFNLACLHRQMAGL